MSVEGERSPALWPPAFSTSYLTGAHLLLERRGALLVVGAPGSNRKALVEGMLTAAGTDDSVWRHRARRGDQTEPLHALRVLASHLGCDGNGDTDVLIDSIRSRVRTELASRPTAVLDEVDFCDPESLTALATLVVTRDIRVVAIVTRETLAAVPQFAAVAERLDVVPLTAEVIARLVAARFGAEPHRTVSAFLSERSQGSYAVVCTIADAAYETGMLHIVDGVLMVDPSRLEDVRQELPELRSPRSASRLGDVPSVVDLLQVVSIIGELEQSEIADLISPDDLTLALHHGAVRVDDGVITMADPLEAEAVVALISAPRLTELWTAYGARLGRSTLRDGVVLRSARWCLEARCPLPPALAAAGAADANLRGIYRRAIQLTDQDILVAPNERAYALRETGDLEGLRTLYDRVDPTAVPDDDLLAYVEWASPLADGSASDLRDRALAGTHDPEARRRRDAIITLAGFRATSSRRTSGELIRAMRTLALSGVLSPVNQAMAYSTIANLLRHAGQASEAVESARIALSLLQTDPHGQSAVHLDAAQETLFFAHVTANNLAAADAVLDEYAAPAARYGGSGRLGHKMSLLLELTRGNVPLALASARMFLLRVDHDVHGFRGWVEALAGSALVATGRPQEGADLLAASERHPSHHSEEHDLERRLAQASTHDILGDPDRALEMIEGVTAEAREHGLRRLEVDAAGMAVMVDGPSWLRGLFGALDGFVDPGGSVAVWQRFALAAHAYDFATLMSLAIEMHERQNMFFATKIAQYVLDSARRATDLDDEMRVVLDRLAGGDPTPLTSS